MRPLYFFYVPIRGSRQRRGSIFAKKLLGARRRRHARSAANDEIADLRHVLHRETHPFAPQPAVLDAAIRHVVDAVARHVVDHDAADLEPVPGIQHLEDVAGEDARLQPELAVVDDVQRGIEIVESVLVGEFNINESRQDILTSSFALRYGLTDRLELGVRVPFVHRADTSVLVPVQGSTNNDAAREINSSAQGSGIGDLELSARYQLLTGRAGVPFVVGNLQVVAPVGSNPFSVPRRSTGEATRAATGAGFWGVSPSVTAILPTDPAVLFGTVGYTRNFGRDVDSVIMPVQLTYVKPGDALSFSAGIGLSVNERTSMNFGYAHSWAFGTLTRSRLLDPRPNDPGVTEQTARDLQLGRLLFGVTYRVNDRASVNWSVEVGATDDAPDVRTVLRMPVVLLFR